MMIRLLILLFVTLLAQSVYAQEAESEAPYVLRIINSGESTPRSSNASVEGRQDNRRADVTLTQKVPAKNIEAKKPSAVISPAGAFWLSKDPASLDRILSVEAPASAAIVNESLEAPIKFSVQTNYASFIEKLELLIWSENASFVKDPEVTIELDATLSLQVLEYDLTIPDTSFAPNQVYQYALRATDAQGRVDQSIRQDIRLTTQDTENLLSEETPSLSVVDESDGEGSDYSELERKSILISGSKVRLFGQDLSSDSRVSVNGQLVEVGEDGRIGLEYLLPEGSYTFDIEVDNGGDALLEKQLSIDLNNNYLFMVALADITAGKNNVSGSLEPLAVDPHHYGGDIFVDGRLAFYLKGKVKGKYLITAQMDTGTEDISNLFDDFHRKDAQSIFRRLDPDQYYPVYGDNSQLIDDTNSQGKLYVRVDWDRSRLVWGNYNTNFTGTEFAPFNRSLYGVQLIKKSVNDTDLGDEVHSLNVFASKAQSLFRHNEFLSTGGSLYYLRDTDIVAGSEKVWVEVRQAGTERVVEKIELIAGRDYDIDDFQGRLILRRPLLSVTANGGPSIIRDEPLSGNETVLIVDYEYSPTNFDFNDSSMGIRAKRWISDHVGIGGTWAREERADDDYDIKGVDLTLKRSEQSFVKTEYAQSESSQTSGSFISNDGGLSFIPFISNNAQTSGSAFGIEARASLSDFIADTSQVEVGVWHKQQDSGFSTANTDVGFETIDTGIEAVSRPSDKVFFYTSASRLYKVSESEETNISGQVVYTASNKVSVSAELKNKREQNFIADSDGASTLVAGKISKDVSDDLNIYGIQQLTLKNSGSQQRNNSTTLGARYAATKRLGISAEISVGDKGKSALFGTEVSLSDTYSIYTNYTYSFNRDAVEKNSFVLGQRKTINSQLKIYSEHQFTDDDVRNGYSNMIGLDQKLNNYSTVSLSLQQAVIENIDGTNTERNTASVGLAYQRDNVSFNSKFEYRQDESFSLDAQQWITTNRLEYRKTPSFRWQGKLNASITDDLIGSDDASFIELGVGFALRPVSNDRLNMLGRLTFLSDLQPRSQGDDTDQRSFIASIEGLYDVSHTWSMGAKLASRSSEIRLRRNEGSWIDNDASLISARARYKAHFGVDATLAYHWLYSKPTGGDRHGALFTIGKQVADNLSFSIGYNFTSFDDDLSNDSYDFKGWFVNLVGTY